MAVDMFLKLDGVVGEVQDSAHTGWIEVSSFSWGVSNTTSIGSATGGAGAGRATFQDLHFEKMFDKASPVLALSCASGKHISSGMLTVRKAGEQGQRSGDFLKIKLTDVFVSSYETAGAEGGDDRPTDGVSLLFLKIEIDYLAPDGSETDVSLDVRQSA